VMARPGTVWSPFTLEWDHWTDSGLKPAAESLRRLAAIEPTILCPAHAEPITKDVADAIRQTASAVEEVSFLKSFERYSDHRLGDAPAYRFLAPDQVASSGDKPWSQVSEHLFITGNTYVLASQTGKSKTMAIDLWGKRSIDQIQKLIADRGLAMPVVVWVSHAHYDHFDGIYEMPERGQFEVWTLDKTAGVLEEPGRFRAPFLDPRPMKVDRKLAPGDEATWQEYRFRIHHLPGQTIFTMGIETTIDGHRSLFTADNFFHMKQFSGSGGWTGLNRALPGGYAASARKILEIAPEWVLAEHGGPFEFDAEDFRRRAAWADAAAGAANQLCVSGDHRRDWDPHGVAVEPCHIVAKPGETARARLVVEPRMLARSELCIELEGRGVARDQTLARPAAQAASLNGTELSIQLDERSPIGRHMLPARVFADGVLQGTDTFVVVDVK
jgi:glyoxylase-like metal-dependent hydrolase (beta-lactamase superfamily II)